MNTLMRCAAVLAALVFMCAGLVQAAPTLPPLRIAPLPMENREATIKAFNPVVSYLQQQLKVPVELVYFDKNSEIVAALKDRTIDMAMLGSLPYVTLHMKKVAVEPLVFFKESTGQARYQCVLVAFGNSGNIRQLRGKSIVLTQPLSTCGYLGTNAILRQHAGHTLEETRYRYLNTHEAAALAVVGGEADAAGIKDEFAAKYAGLGLVVIGTSEWVPALGLFASRDTLSEERIAEIRRVLLATPATTYSAWGNAMKHGMAPAADTDFDALRRFGSVDAIPQSAPAK
jgi:phosphonate transport system substrate-binding protein